MIINAKLTLDHEQLNLIACKIAGKNIKRTATRAEIVDLVTGFITGYAAEIKQEIRRNTAPVQVHVDVDLSKVPAEYARHTDDWKASYLKGRYGR